MFKTTKEMTRCSTPCRQDALLRQARDKALALGVRFA